MGWGVLIGIPIGVVVTIVGIRLYLARIVIDQMKTQIMPALEQSMDATDKSLEEYTDSVRKRIADFDTRLTVIEGAVTRRRWTRA